MRRLLRGIASEGWELVVWLSIPFVVVTVVTGIAMRGGFALVMLTVVVGAAFVVAFAATLGHVRARQAALERELRETADPGSDPLG